jgi:hypothetical protein
MCTLATIREFKTKNFKIVITAEEEDFLDLSFDEDGSIAEGLDDGTYVAFCVKAACYYKGNELATDYLGGCIYRSFEEFQHGSGYFQDMVRRVCDEGRQAFAELKHSINQTRVRA